MGVYKMNNRLKLAYALAEYAHEDQKRKGGQPYIYHPWAVAEAVKHLGEDYQIAGVLHDVVEDTDIELGTITNIFGWNPVGKAVMSVTRVPGISYDRFILAAKQNIIGKQIKIADIKHNLSTLDGIPSDSEREYLRNKWEDGLKVLLDE
jgi:guanosine-3',5'-bis(diphosphate) 3'-pyrophosphohydrolase